MKKEMNDFNKFAIKQSNMYYVLKIILYCLSAVVGLAGIVLAIVFHSVWIGITAWFICLSCFYAGNYMGSLQSCWASMTQTCPNCGATDIKAEINPSQNSFRKFDKFSCAHCKQEWDNSETLKKIHE